MMKVEKAKQTPAINPQLIAENQSRLVMIRDIVVVLSGVMVRIPTHPTGRSDHIQSAIPGYPATCGSLPHRYGF